MEHCFNHKEVKGVEKCGYCAKTYCEECLSLHTTRKVVICNSCLDIYTKKIKKVVPLNTGVAIFCLVFAVFCITSIFLYWMDYITALLMTLFFCGIAGKCIRKNKNYKEFLIQQRYTDSV